MLSFSFQRPLVVGLLLLFSLAPVTAKSTLGGIPHFSVNDIARKFNMKIKWLTPKEEAMIYNAKTKLTFHNKKRYCSLNDRRIWLGNPTRFHKNKLFLSEKDFFGTIAPILTPKKTQNTPRLKHIVIDPGHGGKDHGTANKVLSVKEKEMTLDVSIRLKRILQAHGYTVSLTRADDTFVPLKKRPQIANQRHADFFVSIHFNAVASKPASVKGIETYALTLKDQPSTASHKITKSDRVAHPGNKHDNWNALAGFYIHNTLIKDLNAADRGLKRARFAVLKPLACPGILIEGGFVSHPAECKNIKSARYRQQLAQSIANGIIHYHKALKHIQRA